MQNITYRHCELRRISAQCAHVCSKCVITSVPWHMSDSTLCSSVSLCTNYILYRPNLLILFGGSVLTDRKEMHMFSYSLTLFTILLSVWFRILLTLLHYPLSLFYESRSFMAVITEARHWTISWANIVQRLSQPKIHFNIIVSSESRYTKWSSPVKFRDHIFVRKSHLTMCATCAGLNSVITHSWSWALLEKPPVVQLLKNFPKFYGIRRFITLLTRAFHWSLEERT
jgi:hypothetical protein